MPMVPLVDAALVLDGAGERMIIASGRADVKVAAPVPPQGRVPPQVRARRVQPNQSWANQLSLLRLARSLPMEIVVP
jgi:hypothetical protein